MLASCRLNASRAKEMERENINSFYLEAGIGKAPNKRDHKKNAERTKEGKPLEGGNYLRQMSRYKVTR